MNSMANDSFVGSHFISFYYYIKILDTYLHENIFRTTRQQTPDDWLSPPITETSWIVVAADQSYWNE